MTLLRRALIALTVVLGALAVPAAPAAAAEVQITYAVGTAGSVSTDVHDFASVVGSTLGDPDGWSLGGSIEFVPVRDGADVWVLIAEPSEVGAVPGCSPEYSCHVSGTIYINEERWNQGAPGWSLDLHSYRHYVVNHEMGHYLGLGHVDCPAAGAEAPVMMQQSIETEPCTNRIWPLPEERQAVADRYGVTVREQPSGEALVFVETAYERILQRSPADDIARQTARRVDAGEITRAEVIDDLFASMELDLTTAAVGRLYFATFLRAPEPGGLFHWTAQVQSGHSLPLVAKDFAASAEFEERYGDLDAEQFVERLYRNVLGRAAEPEGKDHWTSRLRSGELHRGEVLDAFAQSEEHRDRRDVLVIVSVAYAAILDRTGDPDGVRYWTDQLRSGTPRVAMIDTFLSSEESVF